VYYRTLESIVRVDWAPLGGAGGRPEGASRWPADASRWYEFRQPFGSAEMFQ